MAGFWGNILSLKLNLLYGVEVRPGEPYVHEPSPDGRLRITQAMLGSFGDDGWSMLHCSVGNSNPVRLCTLNPMQKFMCHLELEFQEKENAVFSVSGISSIHLSGFYIHPDNVDQDHSTKKLTSETTGCSKRKHSGNMADANIHASLMDPITEDDGKNSASLKGPILGKADSTDDVSLKVPILIETDGKNGAILKDDIVKGTDGMNDAYLKSHVVTEADGKNDASLKEPIDAEVDVKNDVSLKKPIVGEDENYDDEHLPIRLAFSKRMATKKRKCKSMRIEKVPNDQNNDMDQVDDQNYCKIMDSNMVVSTQDHDIEHKGHIFQSVGATSPIEQSDPLMDGDFIFTGATDLQNAAKQGEYAENSERVHTGKDPIHNIKDENGVIIEDLERGRSDGKIMASNGDKVIVKYVGKLENGQIGDPKNTREFKLGTGEVMPGWDAGISGMRVGDKRKVTIPPSLGHGDKAVGIIPGNSCLIYEFTLKKVKRSKKASQAS